MADWKQITSRIRRARTGKDPLAQLSVLFDKTRDAMVAFELGKFLESKNENSDAARWYATAAERFRRSDWKTKAREAATRLGGGEPFSAPAATESAGKSAGAHEPDAAAITPATVPEPALPFLQNAEVFEAITATPRAEPSDSGSPARAPEPAEPRGRRRRGRRGGRNHRRSGTTTDAASRSSASTPAATSAPPAGRLRTPEPRSIPLVPVEPLGDSGPSLKGRFGDPGLSSRLSLLEMQFRRLLTCSPVRLDEAGRAPAGPGVFVLTDEEMTTYYYVEACDTLRIAIAQLARGSAGRRGNAQLKAQMAEHLGIAESRVAKYLSDHCVVRWLQLDEGATYFAHFAIAVLRPALND